MSSAGRARTVVAAIWTGLAATVLATTAPYLLRNGANSLAGHIRAGYPSYWTARVDTAVHVYLAYLTGVNVLGVAGWLAMLWAVRAGKPWRFWAALTIFGGATAVALFDLLVKDTSGDTGLPPALGWLELVPCGPGLITVVLLRRPAVGVGEIGGGAQGSATTRIVSSDELTGSGRTMPAARPVRR
jgi:hypothetical protein